MSVGNCSAIILAIVMRTLMYFYIAAIQAHSYFTYNVLLKANVWWVLSKHDFISQSSNTLRILQYYKRTKLAIIIIYNEQRPAECLPMLEIVDQGPYAGVTHKCL